MNIAVYAGSRNLYPFMTGSIKSMLKNGGADKIYLIIEDDAFPEWMPEEVEVINFSGQQFFGKDCPNIQTKFTYLTLSRLVLTKILPPDVDKVLSMDCDTVVMGSLEEIWDRDMTNYYLSATREPYLCRWDKHYHNTGVSIHNLKKIREDGKDDEMVKLVNSQRFNCVEQDAMNIILADKILDMPSEYNWNDYVAKPFNDVKIRHYAGHGVQVWGYLPDVQHYIRMPWDEVLRNRRRST